MFDIFNFITSVKIPSLETNVKKSRLSNVSIFDKSTPIFLGLEYINLAVFEGR
jgi:hypothetical protein